MPINQADLLDMINATQFGEYSASDIDSYLDGIEVDVETPLDLLAIELSIYAT